MTLGAACGDQDPCAVHEAPCGGNPVGRWSVTEACKDPVFRPPLPITYFDQPKGTAREMPPEPTSSDWCSYLRYGPNGTITGFIFPYDALAVSGGNVTYVDDGTYNVLMAVRGKGSVELSASCLTQFGATPTDCQSVASALGDYAESQPAYTNIACTSANQPGACRCTYDLVFDNTINGRWSLQDNKITHFDANHFLPSQVEYCVDGATAGLKIWGRDRTAVWDQPGVRTLWLSRSGGT